MEATYLWVINIISAQRIWLLPLVLFVIYGLVIWGLLGIFRPAQDEIDDC